MGQVKESKSIGQVKESKSTSLIDQLGLTGHGQWSGRVGSHAGQVNSNWV